MQKILIIYSILFIFYCSGIPAQDLDSSNSPILPKVEIAGTQLLKIHSDIVNQDYDLYINLPANYSDTSKGYPVVYLLDAQWDFSLVSAIYGEQYYDGFLPGLIIVGITWGGDNPNYDTLRARDFTPIHLKPLDNFGNAPKFLEFIKNELVPFIDSKYRTDKNDRTLMGSSLGGLFTLYTLFNETNLFERYALTSPALKWGKGIINNYEANYSKNNSKLPAKLYTGIGEYEDPSDFQKFTDKLKLRNYRDLEFMKQIIKGVGHSGGKAEGYTKGLQFVFTRPSLAIPSSALSRYSGTYQENHENKIRIYTDKNHLTAVDSSKSKFILLAETDKDFYRRGVFYFIHFNKNINGKITGFSLNQFNKLTYFTKVE